MKPVYAIPVAEQQPAYPVFDPNANNTNPNGNQIPVQRVYPVLPETYPNNPSGVNYVSTPIQVVQSDPNVPPTPMYPNPNVGEPVVLPPPDVAPQNGDNVLLTPDAHFFQAAPQEVVSPYPNAQKPKGESIRLFIDTDEQATKQKNALAGVGVGVAASILTGGLAIPLIAGVAVYNMLKQDSQSVYMSYSNSFVWELRSAMAEEYDIKPELILLKRKDVIMDDNEQLKKYVKNKHKVTIDMRVSQVPVAGSNYYFPNGSVYPKSQTVTQIRKHK